MGRRDEFLVGPNLVLVGLSLHFVDLLELLFSVVEVLE